MNFKNGLILLVVLSLLGIIIYYRHSTVMAFESSSTLRVGINAEFPPFEFIKDDKTQGFDIDLINEIANELDKTIEFRDMPFDALIPALQLGTIHVAISGMTPTSARERQILFTTPYISDENPLVIVIHAHRKDITNVEDLVGKEVVVNEGFTADEYLSGIQGINLKRLLTLSEGFLALKNNQADAFVTAQNTLQDFFTKESKKAFKLIPIENTKEDSAIAVSKKYPKLLPNIQRALDKLIQDGTVEELKHKWNLL